MRILISLETRSPATVLRWPMGGSPKPPSFFPVIPTRRRGTREKKSKVGKTDENNNDIILV